MVDQMLNFFSGIARLSKTAGLVLGVSKGEDPTTPADTSKRVPDLVRRPILCWAFRTVKLRWLTVVDFFLFFLCNTSYNAQTMVDRTPGCYASRVSIIGVSQTSASFP